MRRRPASAPPRHLASIETTLGQSSRSRSSSRKESSNNVEPLDLAAAAAAMAQAARAARAAAVAAARVAATARRGIATDPEANPKRRQRPQSAPFRHRRGLDGMRRQLEHEHLIARHKKRMHDEGAMEQLYMRMDAQAGSVARLMHQTDRRAQQEESLATDRSLGRVHVTWAQPEPEPEAEAEQQTFDSGQGSVQFSCWAQVQPEPEPEPEAKPEPEQPDSYEVSAVRIACLTSMDTAIANARLANEKQRILAEQKAQQQEGPRLAAAQAATAQAQRKKAEAAAALERVAAARGVREEAVRVAIVEAAQSAASEMVASAMEEAAEEESASWARQNAALLSKQTAHAAAQSAAAQVVSFKALPAGFWPTTIWRCACQIL